MNEKEKKRGDGKKQTHTPTHSRRTRAAQTHTTNSHTQTLLPKKDPHTHTQFTKKEP